MILYLGNNLSMHGNTPSSIETLGKLLATRYSIERVSNKRNQLLRWADMMLAIIRFRRTISVVLIDTYSTLGFYYAFGAAVICRLGAIPFLPILRGGNLKERLQKNPGLSRLIFGNAALLVAPSGYLWTAFKEFGYENVAYIPNSIELQNYKVKERTSVRPRLLWVRSFHQIYNPLMAIQVLDDVLQRFPDAELCMVGPDRDESLERCKDYVRHSGLEAHVKFTGVLSKLDWTTLSREYDIFINTTTVDNTPVSVIEAMALGLPVVSTNVGGVPYLLADRETGLLVESGDRDAMVQRIFWLIDNPIEAHNLAANARHYVEQLDWEVVKHKWFSLLDQFEDPLN